MTAWLCCHVRNLNSLCVVQNFEKAGGFASSGQAHSTSTMVPAPATNDKPAQQQQQQRQQSSGKAASGLGLKPSSKPAQAQANKPGKPTAQPQQLQAAPKAAPPAQHAAAVVKPLPQTSVSAQTLPAAAAERTSGAHAMASQDTAPAVAQTAATVVVTDEWADKGVPVQSGYLQSGYLTADSPLPDEEDLVSDRETSRPPSTDRQQVNSEHHELAPALAQVTKAATGRDAVSSVAPSKAQSSKGTLQEKVLLPAGKDSAQGPSSSKASLPTLGEAANLTKQPPNRQSSSTPVATSRTAASAGKDIPPMVGKRELADLSSTPPRLSGSSSSRQAQHAEAGKASKTPQGAQRQDPSPSRPKQTTQPPSSSAKGPSPRRQGPSASERLQGKSPPSKGLSTSASSDQLAQQVPRHSSSPQEPPAVGVSATQTNTAPAPAVERSTKTPTSSPLPPAVATKPSAPRQSSAALSGKAAAAGSSPAPRTRAVSGGPQLKSSTAAVLSPQQKQSGSVDRSAADGKPSKAVQSPAVPSAPLSQPESKSQPSRRTSLSIPLPASPQEPPIPGLASPEGPVIAHNALPQAVDVPSQSVLERVVSEPRSSWVPPPPAEAPPQPPQIPSDPYPPEPSSPRPTPAVGDSSKQRGKRGAAEPAARNGPIPPSDSGEDMEIDGEAGKEALPPLPTEPFPLGFELATIDNNRELVEVTGEERDTLLQELSGIHVSYLVAHLPAHSTTCL